MSDSPLIDSLTAALDARPGDLPLRLHLAQLLLGAGRLPEAIAHLGVALQQEPGNPEAQALMRRAIGGSPARSAGAERAGEAGLDWGAYEDELSDAIPPRYVRADDTPDPVAGTADRIAD